MSSKNMSKAIVRGKSGEASSRVSGDWSVRQRQIFGPTEKREEVFARIRTDAEVYAAFQQLNDRLQEEFIAFCMGVQGLNITYDPVFKMIFDPESHPERLEDFLRRCLKRNLYILKVIPNESKRLTQEGSLLVMDIVVMLESGEIVNVEIQRVGYLFPGQRCACYSSDLVMRQYSQVREAKRKAEEAFSYRDVKTVYTIVLIQESTAEFYALPGEYLHYGKQQFDTGLELDMIQEYLMIPLDIFLKNSHNISNKLEAWLLFIASDSPEDIRRIIEAYPEFEEIYREIFRFRYQEKELIGMFSDALRILDKNTVQYMVEQQREEIRQLQEEKHQFQEEKRQFQEEARRKEEENQKLKKELAHLRAMQQKDKI